MGTLLAYSEQLVLRGLNFRIVINYFSATKQSQMHLGISVRNFDSPVIRHYMKAISKMKLASIVKKGVYAMWELDLMFRLNDRLPSPLPYKVGPWWQSGNTLASHL